MTRIQYTDHEGQVTWMDRSGRHYTARTGGQEISNESQPTRSAETRSRSRSKARDSKKVSTPNGVSTNVDAFRILINDLVMGIFFFTGMFLVTISIMFIMVPGRPTVEDARSISCDKGMQHMLAACVESAQYRKCFAATSAAIANGSAYGRIVATCNLEPPVWIDPCMTYTKVGKWVINQTLGNQKAASASSFDLCTFNDVHAVTKDNGLYCNQEPHGVDDGCESVIKAREIGVNTTLSKNTETFMMDTLATRKHWIFSVLSGVDLTSAIAVQALSGVWLTGKIEFSSVELILGIFNMVWALMMRRCVRYNVSAASSLILVIMLIAEGPMKIIALVTGTSGVAFSVFMMNGFNTITFFPTNHAMTLGVGFQIIDWVKMLIKSAGFQLISHIAVGIVFHWVR